MRVILLGAPGSGKGTQAAILAERMEVPSISTGEMLRHAVATGTSLGERIEAIMARGDLVDDQTMADVVRDRLQQADAVNGFILDGYPRTQGQADTLESILAELNCELDAAVHIAVPEEELMTRALARQRADDQQDVILQRLEVYRRQTEPLIDHYRAAGLLRVVDGHQRIEDVAAGILRALEVTV